jgi:hypothetical protein
MNAKNEDIIYAYSLESINCQANANFVANNGEAKLGKGTRLSICRVQVAAEHCADLQPKV